MISPSYGKMERKGEHVMKTVEKAIETTATINADHQLILDEPLPLIGPARVRVIVFLPEQADIEEGEWLRSASIGGAFDFLKASEEDIYTLADGRPFHDQR
jgi:hypothetical protein